MDSVENKVLSAGLYSTGTKLAEELQTEMNDLSNIVTCTYLESTNKFNIHVEENNYVF